MKKIKITGFILLFACQLMAQTETKEQLVVPLSDPGKPYFLEVSLVNGSIKVVTYAGKEVIIDAQSSEKKQKEDGKENANGMKRISAVAGFELSAQEKNNKIQINSDSWKRPINLTIKVPQGVSLKLQTVNHGDILVDSVTGKIEVSNVNGAITLTNVGGSVVATTVNGNVIANLKTVEPNAPMAFTTLNGNVDVTLPASVKANVKLKSDRGDIYSDFDIDVSKSEPKVTKSNQSGLFKINVEDWVNGKINGGGPEFLMKNMNGNIMIRKAKQ